MISPRPPAVGRRTEGKSKPDATGVEAELDRLRGELSKLQPGKKRFWRQATNWALLLGIVATGLSLPRAVVDLRGLFEAKLLDLRFDERLLVDFVHESDSLSIKARLTVSNDTEKILYVPSVTATFDDLGDSTVYYSGSDIECVAGSKPLWFPLPLEARKSHSVECTASRQVQGTLLSLVEKGEDWWALRFRLRFGGSDNRSGDGVVQDFCLVLTPGFLDQLSEAAEPDVVENTDCAVLESHGKEES